MKNNIQWILVTDGAHARILQQNGKGESLIQIQSLNHNHESTHNHGSDKPGRGFEGGTTARHAYEPKTDWHDHQKELFIKELFPIFIKERQEKKFRKMYIICPAKILGFFRATFQDYMQKLPDVEKITITEIVKDLTHQTLEDIEHVIESAA
jgi:protein required for attachment to host cells